MFMDVGEVAVVLVWRVGLPECYVLSYGRRVGDWVDGRAWEDSSGRK